MGRNGLARQNGIGHFLRRGAQKRLAERLVTMTADCREDVAAILTGLNTWMITSEWSDSLCCFSKYVMTKTKGFKHLNCFLYFYKRYSIRNFPSHSAPYVGKIGRSDCFRQINLTFKTHF